MEYCNHYKKIHLKNNSLVTKTIKNYFYLNIKIVNDLD